MNEHMNTESTIEIPQDYVMPADSLTNVIGAVNNEIKLSMLYLCGGRGSDEYLTRFDTNEKLSDFGANTVALKGGLQTAHQGLILERLESKGLVSGSKEDGYQRSLLGDAALGFGGIVFDSGYRNNVAISAIIGEDRHHTAKNMHSSNDPVATRMAVWSKIYQSKPMSWLDMNQVSTDIEDQYGIGERNVRKTIGKLEHNKVVETRKNPRHKKYKNFRLKENEESLTDYRSAIGDYFSATRSLATLDIEELNRGRKVFEENFEKIVSNGLLEMIFKRTRHNSSQYGKKITR